MQVWSDHVAEFPGLGREIAKLDLRLRLRVSDVRPESVRRRLVHSDSGTCIRI